jgi:uncharacterized protein (TIGR02145 family)
MKRKICKFKNQLISSSPNQLITKSAHLLILMLISSSILAQSPQKMSYQCVVRNASGALATNQVVGIKISLLQGSTSGTAVYTEILTPTTNANGLVSIEIGGGTGFDLINWSAGPYFLKTETDPAGGTNYTISGTSQLLSVPYALHSKTVASYTETDPVFAAWDKSAGINITESQISDLQSYLTAETQTLAQILAQSNNGGGLQIKNIAAPTDNRDVVTKDYTDALKTQLQLLRNTLLASGFLTDNDGNTYSTVKIGDQIWMAENLKTTKYNDGTAIPLVASNTEWAALGTPAYCWYNDDITNKDIYGALYNWFAVNAAKLCPTGWHVPSDDEWKILEGNVDSQYGVGDPVWENRSIRGYDAGAKMKEIGGAHWTAPNTGATNESGFTGVAGGNRGANNGQFYDINWVGYWWTSTQYLTGYGWWHGLLSNFSGSYREFYIKRQGNSIRCLKDT